MNHNIEMTESTPVDQPSNKIEEQKEDDEYHRQCINELRNIFLQVNRCQQEPNKHVR